MTLPKAFRKICNAAVAEWNQSQDALARERQRFEKVCQKLDDAINLRGVHWYIVGTLAACVVALLIGHYVMASLKSAIECRQIHHGARESGFHCMSPVVASMSCSPPLPSDLQIDPPPGSRGFASMDSRVE